MLHVPVAKPGFQGNPNKACDTDTTAVADGCCAETEFAICFRDLFMYLGEHVDVDCATKKTLPEDDGEDDVDRRYEEEQGMQCQQDEIAHL